jgi:arabinan endo-1,5-alpha-L-arabinosidase
MKFYKKIKHTPSVLMMLIASVSFAQEIVVHDPVVIKQKDTYYLYCTGNGISVFSSKDLKKWDKQPPVFAEKPVWADGVAADFKNHIWAPDISLHNNTYYLYYSVSAFAKNTSAIGVATNTTLDPKDKKYKWVDQGIVIQSQPNRDMWNAIDPSLIFDEKQYTVVIIWFFLGRIKVGKTKFRFKIDCTASGMAHDFETQKNF